ncbi:MAG: alpha-L-rhamnosidase N-terminal domain-containing protein [Planctomycetota bacterium]
MVRLAALVLLAACATEFDRPGSAPSRLLAVDLRTEDQVDPVGLDARAPRLSWRLQASDGGGGTRCRQTAYRLVAARSAAALPSGPPTDLGHAPGGDAAVLRGPGLDSGVVTAAWTPHVVCAGLVAAVGERVSWCVRVRDGDGKWSSWSTAASFVQGPRDASDWPGPWLGTPPRDELAPTWVWHDEDPHQDPHRSQGPPPGTRYFRASFDVTAPPPAATLYVHADDRARVWLNGRAVARGGRWDRALAVELGDLQPGRNAFAVAAENDGPRANPAGLALVLVGRWPDGDRTLGPQADDWRSAADAADGWQEVDFDDRAWRASRVVEPQHEWRDAMASRMRAPDPRLRRRLELTAVPVQAILHVASVGYHTVWVNGVPAGQGVLAPHVSDLRTRARFTSYDITGHLRAGGNTLGLELGRGWAQYAPYGHGGRCWARVRLDVFSADGTHTVFGTEAGWQWQPGARTLLGAWRFRDFGGERVEAMREQQAWCSPDATSEDEAAWLPAATADLRLEIAADGCARNRAQPPLAPSSIALDRDGSQRIDFGRSATGLLALRLRGAPGACVELSMSEREGDDVTYGQRSELVLDRDGRGVFQHRHNYVAGRWLTVAGATTLRAEDVRFSPVTSDVTASTEFSCSHDLLNQVWQTAIWTLRNLALGGYVVDCPHRERLGYGGDAHATMATMLAACSATAFYRKWLQDWRDVQLTDGDLPPTAPTLSGGGGPAWSGIVVMLPWALFVETGDLDVLRANVTPMRRWIEFLQGHVQDGLLTPYGDPTWAFAGDWVPPGHGQEPGTRVPDEWTLFFNNCYWIDTLATMARVVQALGHDDEARAYGERAAHARLAVRDRFFDARRGWVTEAQPYLAMVLRAGLCPPPARAGTVARLAAAIAATGHHIDAGIHGTAYLLEQLSTEDRDDLAFAMIAQTDYPGWGHMLAQGATTLWEQWDGEHSRLHSSFVSVGAWFVRGLAGIRADPEHPGYAQFTLAPAPVTGVSWVRCRHTTVRGVVESHWRIDGGHVVYDLLVPPGTRARMLVPGPGPGVEVDGALCSGTRAGSRTEVWLEAGRHRVRAPRPRVESPR